MPKALAHSCESEVLILKYETRGRIIEEGDPIRGGGREGGIQGQACVFFEIRALDS
jgi:hypothetical protein